MSVSTHTTGQSTEPVAAFILTDADVDQAQEVARENELLLIAHPDAEDRLLHRHNLCDGACMRFRCFR
jgi:hypothetical protein